MHHAPDRRPALKAKITELPRQKLPRAWLRPKCSYVAATSCTLAVRLLRRKLFFQNNVRSPDPPTLFLLKRDPPCDLGSWTHGRNNFP